MIASDQGGGRQSMVLTQKVTSDQGGGWWTSQKNFRLRRIEKSTSPPKRSLLNRWTSLVGGLGGGGTTTELLGTSIALNPMVSSHVPPLSWMIWSSPDSPSISPTWPKYFVRMSSLLENEAKRRAANASEFRKRPIRLVRCPTHWPISWRTCHTLCSPWRCISGLSALPENKGICTNRQKQSNTASYRTGRLKFGYTFKDHLSNAPILCVLTNLNMNSCICMAYTWRWRFKWFVAFCKPIELEKYKL